MCSVHDTCGKGILALLTPRYDRHEIIHRKKLCTIQSESYYLPHYGLHGSDMKSTNKHRVQSHAVPSQFEGPCDKEATNSGDGACAARSSSGCSKP